MVILTKTEVHPLSDARSAVLPPGFLIRISEFLILQHHLLHARRHRRRQPNRTRPDALAGEKLTVCRHRR